jgi:hypothetical protein
LGDLRNHPEHKYRKVVKARPSVPPPGSGAFADKLAFVEDLPGMAADPLRPTAASVGQCLTDR